LKKRAEKKSFFHNDDKPTQASQPALSAFFLCKEPHWMREVGTERAFGFPTAAYEEKSETRVQVTNERAKPVM